jgi:DNA-binding transcriptional LysR family regulator
VALLERDGRRVRLTPAARGLVAATDRVLAELDAAEAELAAEQVAVRGELVIGAFPSAAAGLVVPAVAELQRVHPELTCSVREHEPEDGLPLLRSGALDLLVSESYDDVPAAAAGGLESQRLLSEPLLLVTGESEDPLPLAARRDDPWIAGLAGTQFAGALEAACAAAGFAPRIVHRADDARLVQALVAGGLGVALLPALACTPADGVAYHEIAPRARRHVWALARRGATRRPALAAALKALQAVTRRSCSAGSPR